jgi:hypothetical protein
MLWLLLLSDCTSWLHSIPHNAGNHRRFKRGMDAQPQSFLRHYNIARSLALTPAAQAQLIVNMDVQP